MANSNMKQLLSKIFPSKSETKNQIDYVPANINYSQLNEIARNGGQHALEALFDIQIGLVRVPFRCPILTRCVTLLSSIIAQLVTKGSLRIVDKSTGNNVSNQRNDDILKLLHSSPDGVLPAYNWIESTASDLLTDSNCVIRVEREFDGTPVRLFRQSLSDITVEQSDYDGSYVYESRDWGEFQGIYRKIGIRNIIHSRWGSLLSPNQAGSKMGLFAESLLHLLKPTLAIADAGEEYIKKFFVYNAGSAPFVILQGQPIHSEQRAEFDEFLETRKARQPFYMGGLGSDYQVIALNSTPQDDSIKNLREYQISEIARVYGIPSPLVGIQITSWGSGIEQLGRFAWRFGIQQMIDRYLSGFEKTLLEPGQGFMVDALDLVRGSTAEIVPLLQLNRECLTQREKRLFIGVPPEPDGEIIQPVPNPKGNEKGESKTTD